MLEYRMLLLSFLDAISEGDGDRILRSWKYFLLYLRNEEMSAAKYSLEALYLLCQVNAILSPQAAHRLIWNRTVKNKAGLGGNIPLDLQLEFYNKVLKGAVRILAPTLQRNLLTEFVMRWELPTNYCTILIKKSKCIRDLEGISNLPLREI